MRLRGFTHNYHGSRRPRVNPIYCNQPAAGSLLDQIGLCFVYHRTAFIRLLFQRQLQCHRDLSIIDPPPVPPTNQQGSHFRM